MSNRLRCALAVLGLSLALAGCFESDKPLIAADAADHPLPPGGRYELFTWDEVHGRWLSQGQGPMNAATRYAFKSIGDGYYIVQGRETEKPDKPYRYGLFKIGADTVLVFDVECEADVDSQFVLSGDIDDIDTMMVCKVSRLDGLTRVFRARIAAGLHPIRRYERRSGS